MRLKDNRIARFLYYKWLNFWDKHSYIKGSSNHIINKGVRVSTRIQITGHNNTITIEEGALIKNSLVKITGSNNNITLQKSSFVSGAELWIEDDFCELIIGDSTFVGHHSHLACTENHSKLIIGAKGMISSYVQIRTGDSHSLIDMYGNRLNSAKSVFIGNHCWLGEGCKVLKGVVLSDDTIVSTSAVVTKSSKKNVLLGGVPAKIIKESVTWDKNRI